MCAYKRAMTVVSVLWVRESVRKSVVNLHKNTLVSYALKCTKRLLEPKTADI